MADVFYITGKDGAPCIIATAYSDGLLIDRAIKLSPAEAVEFAKWILKQYDYEEEEK